MAAFEHQTDLDWTAFCYAAGELTPAEALQFEARLAAEQPAREALARAVELTQAVAAAESHQEVTGVAPAVRKRATWATRLSWMAIGGVAAALIAVLWSGAWNWNTAITSSGNLLAQRELAAAWSQARDEIASAKEEGQWPMVAIIADDEPLPGADLRDDDLAQDEAPSWMTAAVFGLAGKTLDADPFTNERGDN